MKRIVILLYLVIFVVLCSVVITSCSCNSDKTTKKVTKSSQTESKKDNSGKSSKSGNTSNSKNGNSSNASKTSSLNNQDKTPKQCSVVFRDEKGNIISKQKVKNGSAAKTPDAPKKKGYYFYSWSRSVDNVTGDIEVTAVYLKDGTVPQIELERKNAKVGDNVEIKVLIMNNPGIASLSLDVLYDKEYLKLTGFTYNIDALDGAATVPFNEKADPPCLSMVNSRDNITGDFEYATLSFKVLEGSKGSYPITITCDDENVYNIDENNVHFELVNGLITVK